MDINNCQAYELIRREELEGIQSAGYLLRHKKSGARVVLIENDDDNKVFSIAFRTPPSDSTGVPHIMEHSVLCGSEHVTAKVPFVDLVKGSLNTFLNAMTYPDKTVYPVASCNDADFQNLMHVYMDAVLHPNIYDHDEIFRQEGWSYRLEEKDGKLSYNGVVYNEMKGAFSSADSVLDRVVLNTLFPDTCYANESGGDPDVIPQLTYEQFLDFHRKYYHPSNSYIYLYGDMDMEEKLNWLDEAYLCHYGNEPVDSRIRLQEPFEKMVEKEIFYSIASDEPEEDNTYLSYNKVIGTSLDRELYLAFQILDYALLSAPGAPLKKALTDAGIGKDIMGSYDNGIYQPIFSVIAKNANVEQKGEFIRIIEDVLAGIADRGLDRKALEAGINYHEFRYREADFGSYPKGLMYGLQMMDSWLYDEEQPFIHIQAGETFEKLKERTDTDYFESLIQTYMLDNTHSSLLVLYPQKGFNEAREARTAKRLADIKARMSEKERADVVKACAELKAYQEKPDRKEDIEKIPVLKISDIEKTCRPYHNRETKAAGIPVLSHAIETRGIAYVKLLFDMKRVPYRDVPYAGLLSMLLGNLNTEEHSYTELADNVNITTGGITSSIGIYPEYKGNGRFRAMFEMSMKVLEDKVDDGMAIMEEILRASRLSDTTRLKELIGQIKSRLEMMMNGNGHMVAVNRANSYQSAAALYKEAEEGIEYYRFIENIHSHFDTMKDEIVKRLMDLSSTLFCTDGLMADHTGMGDAAAILERPLQKRPKVENTKIRAAPFSFNCNATSITDSPDEIMSSTMMTSFPFRSRPRYSCASIGFFPFTITE